MTTTPHRPLDTYQHPFEARLVSGERLADSRAGNERWAMTFDVDGRAIVRNTKIDGSVPFIAAELGRHVRVTLDRMSEIVGLVLLNTCPVCDGNGRDVEDRHDVELGDDCPRCGGAGWVSPR